MRTTEIELTFLAKYLPADLKQSPNKDLVDVYIPEDSDHPKLRLRKNGEKMMIVKKNPSTEDDLSIQTEQTVILDNDEFNAFSIVKGKRVHKTRYNYKYKNYTAEIDIFLDGLTGLVLIDFEFNNEEEKDSFQVPNFCLVDVTQEKFLAGGMLAGKNYKDIERELERLNYKKLEM